MRAYYLIINMAKTRASSRVKKPTSCLLKKKSQRGLKEIKSQLKVQKQTMTKILKATEDALIKNFNSRCAPNADPIDHSTLEGYSEQYHQDPINLATQNALAAVPISWLAEDRNYLKQLDYAYSNLPEHCPKPTNQAHSGRCWLFAALNTIRHSMIKKLNLTSNFELSEAFLFFYDKIERSLFFMEKMLEFRDESIHHIVVHGMMGSFSPVTDGGTWTFFTNLIMKYGIVPKSCYGENFNSSSTNEMNEILYNKLGQFATEIRNSKCAPSTIQKRIRDIYMPEIYSLMIKFMGEPPSVFDWNYHENSDTSGSRERGTYRSVKDLTPLEFYKTRAESELRVGNMVVLRHDPRPSSEYYRTYHVEHFGNMVGGKPDIALNVPWDVFSKTAAQSVINGKSVWFAADVGKSMNYEYGILSTEAFDYESVLNTTQSISKSDALETQISAPTHAMALVGVDIVNNDPAQVNKWKVENSWGETSGGADPGFLMMTQTWFEKYGYEIVVDIDSLDEKTLEAFEKYEYNPISLPFNDAFGAVAHRFMKDC